MPKLFHVVTPDLTVTFLDSDTALDYLKDMPMEFIEENIFVCESDVTSEDYDKVCKWQGPI